MASPVRTPLPAARVPEPAGDHGALLKHSSTLMAVLDADRRVRYASPALVAQLPSPTMPLLGTAGDLLVHPESLPAARAALNACVETGEVQVVDLRLLLVGRREESAFEAQRRFEVTMTNLLHDPAVRGLVLNAHDITARVAHEKELEHLAFNDRLTGLPNRLRLERELEAPAVEGTRRAVVVLDLDGFKQVNDRLGEKAGDAVLRSMAFRLRREVRQAGLTAYLGGDEFVVLLHDVTNPDEALHLAERLSGSLSEPLRVDEEMTTVGASFGVAVDGTSDLHGDELLRRAHTAMLEAKRRGPRSVRMFDAAGAARAAERAAVAERLVEAEDREELVLHYQPLLSLRDDSVRHAEALLRWQLGDTLVQPDEFISIAEETGLVIGLGSWAMRRACQDLQGLQGKFRFAVNVSARQLHHPNFVRTVEAAVCGTAAVPSDLVIELTESAVVEDPDAAIRVLQSLKDLGVQLAIDDFGTGYSSLSYLLTLPVDILKLDRAFASTLHSSERTRLLIRGVTNIAHDLGMSVTVEGIETAEQLHAARGTGCDTAQGYFIGRPVPLADLQRTRAA